FEPLASEDRIGAARAARCPPQLRRCFRSVATCRRRARKRRRTSHRPLSRRRRCPSVTATAHSTIFRSRRSPRGTHDTFVARSTLSRRHTSTPHGRGGVSLAHP